MLYESLKTHQSAWNFACHSDIPQWLAKFPKYVFFSKLIGGFNLPLNLTTTNVTIAKAYYPLSKRGFQRLEKIGLIHAYLPGLSIFHTKQKTEPFSRTLKIGILGSSSQDTVKAYLRTLSVPNGFYWCIIGPEPIFNILKDVNLWAPVHLRYFTMIF